MFVENIMLFRTVNLFYFLYQIDILFKLHCCRYKSQQNMHVINNCKQLYHRVLDVSEIRLLGAGINKLKNNKD